MKFVYLSSKVQNRIGGLKKSGRAGNQLARKATRIIASLTSGSVQSHRDAIDSYTKYGENRIKNCRKYDLGCGYRLITVQRDSKIYIPFLGPHNECQRWLDKHSRLKDVAFGKGTLFRIPQAGMRSGQAESNESGEVQKKEAAESSSDLSDGDLRRVFCGLVEGAEKQRGKS